MPLEPNLPDRVKDRIASNATTYGRYFMVSFHREEPTVITRGLNQKDWYALKHALENVELAPA